MTEDLSDFHLKRLGSHNADFPSVFLKLGSSTIGRTPTNNIVCNSKYVSRKHCEITVTERGQVTVKNEKTLNGIFINGAQRLERDTEILLNINDILGVGCDTSNDEINDETCYIFQLARKESDTILLVDSDDEEEYKMQEEYSQMNLSEMKQEMMELEDFVEEYSRTKNEEDDGVEFVGFEDEPVVNDPRKVILNKKDNDAEIVPIKDVPSQRDESVFVSIKYDLIKSILTEHLSIIDSSNKMPTKSAANSTIKEAQMKKPDMKKFDDNDVLENIICNPTKTCAEKTRLIKKMAPDVAFLLEKDCTLISPERLPSNEESLNVENFRQDINENEKCTTVVNSPRIKECHVKISLTHLNMSTSSATNSCAPPQQSSSLHNNMFLDPVPVKIVERRKTTFIPSPRVPAKRQVPIIDAPHLMKRRKSMCAMPESVKRQPKTKELNSKWLGKNVQYERKSRSKEEKDEIKSKLAALAPSPKDKVIEPKIIRPNLKIPIKVTRMTRNDHLTDTFVRTMTTPNAKITINGSSHPSETVRKPRFTTTPTTPRILRKEETKVTEKKVDTTSECLHIDNNINTNIQSSDGFSRDCNRNSNLSTVLSSTSTTTTAVVKSILKNPGVIKKRRATVTFAEDFRIKKAAITPSITTDEENCEDVINNIMLLGVSSLKESSSAPINGNNFAYKTVTNQYETLKHLQNVFMPLMKAELWKEVEDGYSRTKNTPSTHVQMNHYLRDENHKNRFTYHCETQSPAAVQNGALIIVSNVHSRKDFLGYIINRQMMNKTCYFQFVTPVSPQESSAFNSTPLTIKPIMYIRPNLKVFEALFKLKHSPLVKHILHPKHNCIQSHNQHFQYKGYNSLNEDQMTTLSKVYLRCTSGKPFITLIEGPPGTGKSRLITNLIIQLLYGNEVAQPLKILLCAPSNAAVDVITKNLTEARKKYLLGKDQKKIKIVRFGVLEKMDRSVQGVSLQELSRNNERKLLTDRGKLMESKKKKQLELEKLSCLSNVKQKKEKIDAIKKEIGLIENRMKVTYDEKCILENANVICTTLTSSSTLSNKISSMDICIIDEATQCNEPTSLIPLQFGVKSLILVGDTKQLPSTVLSEIAKQYNYDQSLFQRLQKSFESENENPILQLTTQYRMHPEILHWPNKYFYQNRLVSSRTTKNDTLKLKPYTVFNLNFEQSLFSGQKHISNEDEANFVRQLLDFLITKADPKLYSYGIISAYSQQKDDLAKDLGSTHPYVTVNTIDSCQGQERDIIIISIARSRGIGFLAMRQRLNVALTRAKKMLIVCGNFNSLQNHSMWTNLLDDAKQRKFYIHLPKIAASSLESFFEKCLC